jgi:hypothetical protein
VFEFFYINNNNNNNYTLRKTISLGNYQRPKEIMYVYNYMIFISKIVFVRKRIVGDIVAGFIYTYLSTSL